MYLISEHINHSDWFVTTLNAKKFKLNFKLKLKFRNHVGPNFVFNHSRTSQRDLCIKQWTLSESYLQRNVSLAPLKTQLGMWIKTFTVTSLHLR